MQTAKKQNNRTWIAGNIPGKKKEATNNRTNAPLTE
jgi:hypothetical protein